MEKYFVCLRSPFLLIFTPFLGIYDRLSRVSCIAFHFLCLVTLPSGRFLNFTFRLISSLFDFRYSEVRIASGLSINIFVSECSNLLL